MFRRPSIAASGLSRGQFLKLSGAAAAAALVPGALRPAFAAAGPLLSRPIPKSKTGETLPAIGLGTSQVFFERGTEEDMAAKLEVVRTLLDNGGNLIDTAAAYRESETIVGELVEKLNARSRTFIVTKFREETKEAGIASMEDSFKQLRTDKIDVMMIHNLVGFDIHFPVVKEWKAAGRFRYIGVSHSNAERQDELANIMHHPEIDFIQLNYSADTRGPEKLLLPKARDNGIAIMCNMPLGRGRLLEAVKGQEVPAWAKEELGAVSFAQLLLKFIISHPAVNVAIPATRRPHYMAENLDAARGPIPDEKQRERIAAIWQNT